MVTFSVASGLLTTIYRDRTRPNGTYIDTMHMSQAIEEFPQLPRQLQKHQAFPEMPRQLRKFKFNNIQVLETTSKKFR